PRARSAARVCVAQRVVRVSVGQPGSAHGLSGGIEGRLRLGSAAHPSLPVFRRGGVTPSTASYDGLWTTRKHPRHDALTPSSSNQHDSAFFHATGLEPRCTSASNSHSGGRVPWVSKVSCTQS